MSIKLVQLGELIAAAKTDRAGKKLFPILSMTMREGLVDQANKFKKRVASEDTSQYKIVQEGQLVVGFPIDEGVLSFQQLYSNAIVSPAYDIWDIRNKSSVYPAYLEKFLRSPSALSFYKGKLKSTTARRRTLPKDTFLSLPVPLPPLDEQKRIAAILDQADSLRRLCQRSLDRLNTLSQAIFHEMFGVMATTPFKWPVRLFGDLVTNGKIGLVRGANEMGEDFPVEYIRMDSIQRDGLLSLNQLKRVHASQKERTDYGLEVGDFLFNTRNSRELVGKTAVVTEPTEAVFNNNILRIRFNEDVSPYYVQEYMRQPYAKQELELRKSGTTSVFAIYQKSLETMPVVLPDKQAQTKFEVAIKSITNERKRFEKSMRSLDFLFASLQHRAFRGEL